MKKELDFWLSKIHFYCHLNEHNLNAINIVMQSAPLRSHKSIKKGTKLFVRKICSKKQFANESNNGIKFVELFEVNQAKVAILQF